jgi:hypothetical protein
MAYTADEIRSINERSDVLTKRKFEAERNEKLRPFQVLADSAYNQCGLGTAPRRRAGESEVQHSVAVLDELLGAVAHLPTLAPEWKGYNPRTISDKATIDAIAPTIFKDSVSAMNATGPGSGPERMIEKRDGIGRAIRTFAGDFDPWAPFKPKTTRLVTAWNPDGLGRGAKRVGAIVPASVTMTDGTVRPAR